MPPTDVATKEQLLGQVLRLSTDLVPAAAHASITVLLPDGTGTTVASSGPVATALDQVQYAAGDGPCLRAAARGGTVAIQDMQAPTAWSAFTAAARSHGVLSSLSTAIGGEPESATALNLYAEAPGAFDVASIGLAALLADVVGAALLHHDRYQRTQAEGVQLQEALDSRAVIEQAKGILMGQRGIDADEAFQVLVALSQHANRKLRDVAEALVQSVLAD